MNPHVTFSFPIRPPSYLGSDPAKVNFTLKCNEFINQPQTATNPITRKGLVIGEGVQVNAPTFGGQIENSIGGPGEFSSGSPYPNANVWPTSSDRDQIPAAGIGALNTQAGWGLSPSWVSIENHLSNPKIKYHHFLNEFVGYDDAIPGFNSFELVSSAAEEWVVTGNQSETGTHKKACLNFKDNQGILFPARIVVADTADSFTSALPKANEDGVWLGDASPNPANTETKIEVSLPFPTEMALLQILDLPSGRVLQNVNLRPGKKQTITLDISRTSSGVYGYRLITDGLPSATKKMVVVH